MIQGFRGTVFVGTGLSYAMSSEGMPCLQNTAKPNGNNFAQSLLGLRV